jgi:hypothetical protein
MYIKITMDDIKKQQNTKIDHGGFEYRYVAPHKDHDFYFCDKKSRCKCRSTLKYYRECGRILYTSHSKACKYLSKVKSIKDKLSEDLEDNKFNIISDMNDKNKDFGYNTIEELQYFQPHDLTDRINHYIRSKNQLNLNSKLKNQSLIMPKELTNEQLELLHESVLSAFKNRNLKFSDDLVYVNDDIKLNARNDEEEVIKELNDSDKFIYYQAKENMLNCIYAPLIIAENKNQGGYVVKATDTIAKNTFICEYSGEVQYANKITSSSDSLMELKKIGNLATIDILPDNISNIARFISGINNKTMKYKQNVLSFRGNIDGLPHVILYASKIIQSGEILYYNYNEGDAENPYNTADFNDCESVLVEKTVVGEIIHYTKSLTEDYIRPAFNLIFKKDTQQLEEQIELLSNLNTSNYPIQLIEPVKYLKDLKTNTINRRKKSNYLNIT